MKRCLALALAVCAELRDATGAAIEGDLRRSLESRRLQKGEGERPADPPDNDYMPDDYTYESGGSTKKAKCTAARNSAG